MLIKTLLFFIYFCVVQFIFSSELLLATDNWPPYYSCKLEDGGFLTVLAKEAYKLSGINLKIEYHPWNRVINKSKNGIYMGVFGAYYNEERAKYYIFSEPILISQTYLTGLKQFDIDLLNNKSLEGLRVGITKGYFYSDDFFNYVGVRFVTSYTVEEGLIKLINGKIDLLTADIRVVNYYNKMQGGEKKLYHIEPPIAQEPVYILISKKTKNGMYYIDAFNKGLQELKESGRFDELLSKY